MQQLNVQQYLDDRPLSGKQWLVFALGVLIILADGLDSGAIGFIAPSLLSAWGIDKPALAPVVSASLVGMAIGALVAGPLADRFGRKWVVIASTVLFGLFTIISGFANNTTELAIFRFITGLGLGAAMPNIATLVAEYMPAHRRATMVNLMFCAFPLGITMGGLLAAKIIPSAGWEHMLMYCGVFPLILAAVLLFTLPESIQYLLSRNRQVPAQKIMRSIDSKIDFSQTTLVLPEVKGNTNAGVALIVSKPYILSTAMLWLCCFMSLLVFYLLTSWMPVLLKQAGFTTEQYSLIAAIFPFGGVFGTALIGWAMDKFQANRALMVVYFISAVLMVLTGLFTNDIVLFGVIIFLAGAGLVGAQSSLPALTALFYPVQGRAAGVSWMHGIGRLGAIFGAFFGAQIFALNLSLSQIFMLLGIPVLVSALALWVKGKDKSIQNDNSVSVSSVIPKN